MYTYTVGNDNGGVMKFAGNYARAIAPLVPSVYMEAVARIGRVKCRVRVYGTTLPWTVNLS